MVRPFGQGGALMDWTCKAMLTTATVALLLTVARLFGRRVAGLLAGMPTVTAPALVWLAVEFGADFAAQAAAGSVAACGLCALFALGYERASRHMGPWTALAAACASGIVLAGPAQAMRLHLGASLFLAITLCLLVLALLPTGRRETKPQRPLRGELLITAGAAGLVTALASVLAPHVGAFWAGVLASPPLVAAAVVVNLHVVHGRNSTQGFLRGYVAGLIGRAFFGATFALAVVTAGMHWTLLAATSAGCIVIFVVTRAMRSPPVRGAGNASTPAEMPFE